MTSIEAQAMWPEADLDRAPVGDFPPPWASAWGDDRFGLWADLAVRGEAQRMRWIEPSGPRGFLMGSPKAERNALQPKELREWAEKNEHDPRPVVVAQGFWLADTPCTQAFWRAVGVSDQPAFFHDRTDAAQRPVEQVSWDDVTQFLEALVAHAPGTRGRAMLPTEAQWEYAARAGTTGAYWWGNDFDPAMAHADVTGKKEWDDPQGTYPVKHVPANPWGLYDIHGNVWEWCGDPWRERVDAQAPDLGDAAEEPGLSARAVRGGSWIHHPGNARSAYRSGHHPGARNRTLGFRLALRSSSPEAR